MSYETIEYSVEGSIATIRLNRPERYNSFNESMHVEMRKALKTVAANKDLRCLVLTGNGKGFCTGQDLGDRYTLVNSEQEINIGKSLEKNYNRLVKMLAALDIPVICAINGVAAGAGISLALACDIVIAVKSAKFVFAFSKVGLIPDAGATWSLVRSLGLHRAKALALLGDTLCAADAERFGLVWRCVEDDALANEVEALTKQMMSNPRVGQVLTKRAMNAAPTNGLNQQLSLEAQLQTIAGRSNDYSEAVRSFVEKREPHFTGE